MRLLQRANPNAGFDTLMQAVEYTERLAQASQNAYVRRRRQSRRPLFVRSAAPPRGSPGMFLTPEPETPQHSGEETSEEGDIDMPDPQEQDVHMVDREAIEKQVLDREDRSVRFRFPDKEQAHFHSREEQESRVQDEGAEEVQVHGPPNERQVLRKKRQAQK